MPTFVADEIVTAAKLNAGTARDWTTWSPTLTNITLGNGTVVARYVQIGKLVHAYFDFTFGSSGSAMGTGPTITLPVTAASTYVASANIVGQVFVLDSGTANFIGSVRLNSSTVAALRVHLVNANHAALTDITASVPMTWAVNDKLIANMTYEAA